jgi:ribonuclease I
MNSRLLLAFVFGLVLASQIPVAFGRDGIDEECRLFAATKLAQARKDLNMGEDLTDPDARNAFRRGTGNVAAILLRIDRQNDNIKSIIIYVSYDGDTKLYKKVVLQNNHQDIQILRQKLRL